MYCLFRQISSSYIIRKSGEQFSLIIRRLPSGKKANSRTQINIFTQPSLRYLSAVMSDTWNLDRVVRALEYMAPLQLAESWDNVGLLLEPTAPLAVHKLLLTNDLTEAVVSEAIQLQVNVIVSYHPPIFTALKRLTGASGWKERCLIRCLENRIAVYSPHTCWDAVVGGVNDWLTLPFRDGSQVESNIMPIIKGKPIGTRVERNDDFLTRLKCECRNPQLYEAALDYIRSLDNGPRLLSDNPGETPDSRILEVLLTGGEGEPLLEMLKLPTDIGQFGGFGGFYEIKTIPTQNTGMGRLLTLTDPLTLDQVVYRIKSHLKLDKVRLAIGEGKSLESAVSSIAACAGSGTGVFKELKRPVDVYWTGEMSHHDVLDVVQRGTSVVLCEHSNTERGFLRHIQPRLTSMFDDKIQVLCSNTDAESLNVV